MLGFGAMPLRSTMKIVVCEVREYASVDSRDPLELRCPKCAAEPGQFCKSTSSICVLRVERRQRRANTKKVQIGRLKAMRPDATARTICELLDDRIKAAPSSHPSLAPLESRLAKAHGAMSWVDVFDHPKTHKLVRNYLNKGGRRVATRFRPNEIVSEALGPTRDE